MANGFKFIQTGRDWADGKRPCEQASIIVGNRKNRSPASILWASLARFLEMPGIDGSQERVPGTRKEYAHCGYTKRYILRIFVLNTSHSVFISLWKKSQNSRINTPKNRMNEKTLTITGVFLIATQRRINWDCIKNGSESQTKQIWYCRFIPCFELWFLLYYECTIQSFEDCEPMKSALQKLNYCKKQKYLKNICRSLRQKLSTALENFKSL